MVAFLRGWMGLWEIEEDEGICIDYLKTIWDVCGFIEEDIEYVCTNRNRGRIRLKEVCLNVKEEKGRSYPSIVLV